VGDVQRRGDVNQTNMIHVPDDRIITIGRISDLDF
jgi:hypothetical protein